MKLPPVLFTSLLLLLTPAARAAQEPARPPAAAPSALEQKLRDGLFAEEAKQDLDAAAAAYRSIVEGFDRDRETASSALFRLGEVYRKQNRTKDAVDCFRRVAREFPDREPLARLARENLAALGEPLPEVPSTAVPGAADPEEERALARLRDLEKQSPDLILNAGNSQEKNGIMSFDEAAGAGHIRVAQWYLDHGASVDKTPAGACPLVLAAGFGRLPMVKFLLEKGAKIEGTEKSEYPLRAAAANGHLAVTEFLADKGADVSGRRREWKEEGKVSVSWSHSPIVASISGGHQSVTTLLLSRKPDLKAYGGDTADIAPYALQAAMERGDVALTRTLLAAGARPGGSKWLPRSFGNDGDRWAAQRVKLAQPSSVPSGYKGYGASDGRARSYPLLHVAVLMGSAEMVKVLLDAGADSEAKAEDPNHEQPAVTPLELAVLTGNEEIATMLVAAGAKATHVASGGVRLIDIAIHRRDVKLYDLLRKAGATAEGRSPSGRSAVSQLGMNIAFDSDFWFERKLPDYYLEWMKRLLDDGADPNGDKDCRPVNIAAAARSLELIQLLKEKGADFCPEKSEADAPLPLAARNFSEADLPAIRALIAAGADVRGRCTRKEPPTPRPAVWRVDGSLLDAVIDAMPDVKLLDEVLNLDPRVGGDVDLHATSDGFPIEIGTVFDARLYWRKATYLLTRAKSEVAAIEARKIAKPGEVAGSQTPRWDRMIEERARLIINNAPGVISRLWDYAFREKNPERRNRVWLQTYAAERAAEDQLASFRAAGDEKESVNLLNAIIYGFGRGLSSELVLAGYNNQAPLPDFSRMVIVRADPATGEATMREPVDFTALLAKGDAAAMPMLQPGDVVEVFAPVSPDSPPPLIGSWRDFPKPLAEGIAAMVPKPKVTVKAGAWERAFELRPWMERFRWDPSTSVLSIEPKLSQVVRYLPKPSFFYRMSAVRFIPKTGEARTLDLSASPPADDPAVRDGDHVEIELLPEDDASVAGRLRNGIFVRSQDDGFLREAYSPDRLMPAWSPEVKEQIIRSWLARSECVLPFSWISEAKITEAGAPGPFGDIIDLPSGRGSSEPWQLKLDHPSGTIKIHAPGLNTVSHEIWLRRINSSATQDGRTIEFIEGGVNSFTLRDLAAEFTWRSPYDTAKKWGTWTLRREGISEPLLTFDPASQALPPLPLHSGDLIQMSPEDAAQARLPARPTVATDGKSYWMSGVGLMSQPGQNPSGTRRRVTLPPAAPAIQPTPSR